MKLRVRYLPLVAAVTFLISSVPVFSASPASPAQTAPLPHVAALHHGRAAAFQPGSQDTFAFYLVRSTAVVSATQPCLPNAYGVVVISRTVQNDFMKVFVVGAAPNTGFDLFVLQIPDKPFGVAWYQSDLETGATGSGNVTVQGIFNKETFSLSQGGVTGGAQTGATQAVTDTNVTFQPTSQYHLGLWFATPQDAARNGCPTTVTPFNGEQNAGIQALSTREFPAGLGPLAAIRP